MARLTTVCMIRDERIETIIKRNKSIIQNRILFVLRFVRHKIEFENIKSGNWEKLGNGIITVLSICLSIDVRFMPR